MKIGIMGLIASDLSDVDYNLIRKAADWGFRGLGAHLTVPAETIPLDRAKNARAIMDDVGLEFLQLWGGYPCIISPDESVRRAGIAQAQQIVKLAAAMRAPASGVRPTSLNPRGDWWPHPDNYKPETEDRLVDSLKEILKAASDFGINIVLETHVTTTLNSPASIRRVIERTGASNLKVNLDPVNFVGDLPTAFDPAPMINQLFDTLEPFIDTVHVKDFYLEDRLTVHVTETVPGTGIMDLDTVLRRVEQWNPAGYAMIEHLPVNLMPLAQRNLAAKIQALGLP